MQNKIVNFLSAKGGVGKSVIVANFGEILSEIGYRTAIIEAPSFSNQEIILNALQGKKISLQSASAVKISQNLTLVSPADGAGENSAKFIIELKEAGIFDFILIDAGLENLKSFAQIADHNVVLCANEPCAISNTYALLKTLGASKKEILFLLNFTASEEDAVMIYENLKAVAQKNISELNFKLLGFVPFCKDVAECAHNRVLFNSHRPFSPATIALRQSVSRFLSKQGLEPIDMSAYRGIGGFLRKLSNLV